MYQHERDGARARAARIRLAHDNEGTRLETLRRHSLPHQPPEHRPNPIRRFAAALTWMRGRAHAGPHDLNADCEPG